MQIVGHCFDQRLQERDRGWTIGLVANLYEGELLGAVDPDEELELASAVRTLAMWM